MIRRVFFDVGNVLLDEDPLVLRSFRVHYEAVRRARPKATFLGLLAEREAWAARGSRWPLHDAIAPVLDEVARRDAWAAAEREVRAHFAELSPPIVGVPELVARLRPKVRLGLIANQGRECREHLERLGLLAGFDVVAFSEELGMYKPDAGLFRHALECAGEAPSQCLMVGDRLDNDLRPASALGMATAWVRWPRRADKGWAPTDPDAIAFRDSLERSSALAAQVDPDVRPSVIVDRTSDLEEALLECWPPRPLQG